MERTAERKDQHLDLCAAGEVEPRQNSSLLDQVHLIHCAVPELGRADIRLEAQLFGRPLKAPLFITGMTGGSERAAQINLELAQVAEEAGVAFGVGSQRAMHEDGARTASFEVRKRAPTVCLVGNIGLTQAVGLGVDKVLRLREQISADGMAVHLNPAQELTQPEGDRDFKGGYVLLEGLVKALGDRLLVKETGCGLSPRVAKRLVELGVRSLDVSGLGGTSWVRVEQLRASGRFARLGEEFSGWGIPTAPLVAAVRQAVGEGISVIASGGIRGGLDAAKALALGANLAGMALPIFRAHQERGVAGAREEVALVVEGITQALLLTGNCSVPDLQRAPKVLAAPVKEWLVELSR